MKTIKEFNDYFSGMEERQIATALFYALEKIKFLEDIYQKQTFNFSDDFTHEAFKERQNMCQLTTACFSLLRGKFGRDYQNKKHFEILNKQ